MAKEHQARYLRFKADEASQTITGPYRQLHPEDNNERQNIHEHVSVPLPILNDGNASVDQGARTHWKDDPFDGKATEAFGAKNLTSGTRKSKVCLCVSVSLWWVSILVLLAAAGAQAQTITFRDITAQAGIHFTHNNGAFGKKWLPETMGPGCAFIDYDNDGWPDILLVNGTDWPGHAHGGATTLKLYHNNHDGTFTDVTRQVGAGDHAVRDGRRRRRL